MLEQPSALRLVIPLLGFVLFGAPLIALVWDALNRIATGVGSGRLVAISVAAAAVLGMWLALLGRTIRRWDARGRGRSQRSAQ